MGDPPGPATSRTRHLTAFLRLTRALTLTFVRNRQGVFWSFFFPVLLMVVFGFLGGQGAFHVDIALAGPPGPVHRLIREDLGHVPIFTIHPVKSVAQGLGQVVHGTADVAMIVPPPTGPQVLKVYYNSSSYIGAQESLSAVRFAVAELNVAMSGRPPALGIVTRPVAGRDVNYLAFLVPGILALMAMQNSLFGLATTVVRWKERGVLRRFFATPLPPSTLLSALVVNQLVIGLVTLAIVLFIGTVILHAQVLVPVFPLLVTLVLGIAAFQALSFMIAGFARTTEAVIPMVNLVSFPMMFLSGIWFPVSSLPAGVAAVVKLFPLTFLTSATRALMSTTPRFTAAIRGDLVGLAVWLIVTSAVAVRTWRWE